MVSDLDVAKRLVHISQSAKERRLEFNLTFRKLKSLLNTKKCYYTDIQFDDTTNNRLSIDRVDSYKGYIDSNVVACIVRINGLKSNIKTDELELILKGINKFNKKKLKTKHEKI